MNSKNSPQEKFVAVGTEKKIKEDIYLQKIHFDDRQYSLKIPKLLMDKIEYKKGDIIKFHLKKPASAENLEITYIRGENAEKKDK